MHGEHSSGLANTAGRLRMIDPGAPESHPSYQSITDLIHAWTQRGEEVVVASRPSRLARRLGVRGRVAAPESGSPGSALLLPLMGPRLDWVPVIQTNGSLELLCWDVWPSNRSEWAEVFARAKPSRVIMTCRDAVDDWSARLDCDVSWIPEATVVDRFDPSKPLAHRAIDVLELGRRCEPFHRAIAPTLARERFVHLFEPVSGRLVFDTQHEMVAGMCDSKIAVCFPGSQTHPEKYGGYTALTQRYFEVMAAGCILVGSTPPELVHVMGYDPVVKVDRKDPGAELVGILSSLAEHEPLVERNRRRAQEVADWSARVTAIQALDRSHVS
jgi:hypothetical protein